MMVTKLSKCLRDEARLFSVFGVDGSKFECCTLVRANAIIVNIQQT